MVDATRIQSLFKELEGMDVRLDPDPLLYGPKRLNKKIEMVRTMLSRCERIFLQVSHDLQVYKGFHRGAQLDFDLQMQDLLANDPEVRAGRNVRDRDALATMKLRDDREHVISMEVAIQDLELVMQVIKSKRADLRDIQGRIRDQMKLCHEEIGLGARWGTRPPPGTKSPDLDQSPIVSKTMLEQFNTLVDGGETHLGSDDVEAWIAPEDTSEEDIDSVLREVETSISSDDGDGGDDVERSIAAHEALLAEAAAEMGDLNLAGDEGEGDEGEGDKEDTPLSEIFDGPQEGEDPEKALEAITSDEEVDDLFAQLDTEPLKGVNKQAANVIEEDIDDIIGMFGD